MNPFVYGETVTNENFCNRKNEIKKLINEIKSGQNIMIYSPRRFGKTSLIYKVFNNIDKNSIFTFYIDLFPVTSEEDFVNVSLRSISKLFKSDIKTMMKKIKGFFKRITPSIYATISNDGTPSIGIDFLKSDSTPIIEDIFSGIYDLIQKKKKQAVIVFDEFQRIGELEETKNIVNTLRGTIQNHRKISYIFMGSKKHLLYDMFNNPNKPFYKSSMHFPLEKIDPVIFSRFIKNKFIKSKIHISSQVSDYIVNTTESHPYYTQMLAHTIWANIEDNSGIDKNDVDNAVKNILNREEAAFINLWDSLTLNQKKILIALSKKDTDDKVYSSEFIDKFKLISSSSVQRGIDSLINKDLVDKIKDNVFLNDIFFKRWIIQKVSF